MTGSALRLPWTQRLPQQQQQQQLSAGGILITGRSLAWRHRQRAVNDANSLRPFITSSPQPLSVLSGSILCPHDAPRSVTAAASVVCSFCAIAAAVPPRPQDGTVSVIILFTIVFGYVIACGIGSEET